MEIRRNSIKEQVYILIKEKILKKEYKLGEYINIQELTREFSVSNTPIREALSSLEASGLVYLSDNYKYRVISLSEKEVTDLNEAILVLILSSLSLIKKSNRVDILEKLLSIAYSEHLSKYENEENLCYEYIRTSINFDRQFVLATDNKYLIKELDSLIDLLILTSIYNKGIYKDIHIEEHKLMLEAIRERDFLKTESILRRHFGKKINDMDL